MQTADSKSDVLAKEGRTVSGAPALEEEVGFGSPERERNNKHLIRWIDTNPFCPTVKYTKSIRDICLWDLLAKYCSRRL